MIVSTARRAERVETARSNLEAAGLLVWAEAFCQAEGATLAEVLGDRVFPRIAKARFTLWAVMRGTFVMSYGDIANMLCVPRNTVAHAMIRRQRQLRAEHAGRAA